MSKLRLRAAALIAAASLNACATQPDRIVTAADAIAAACAGLHLPPACGYSRANRRGDVWEVAENPPEPHSIGGGSWVYLSARTGRVIKMIVGQ